MTWQIDADNISPNSINTGRLSDFLVINEPIREFLDVDTSNRKLFVVGPKGLGKTLLLKVKSQRYRDEQSGFTFIPETELVSKFTNLGVSFSQRELAAFGTLEIWTKLWELALLTAILRRAGAPLPPAILAVLHDASSLPNILGALLSERGKLPRLYNYVHTVLGPAVRDLRNSHGITQLAFFIDNVDEALQDHTGLHLRAPQASSSAVSEHVWINAQLGLLRAAKDLCMANHHIRIYASVRTEAYNANRDSTRLQLDDYCVHLRYTKDEIRSIFFQNIDNTSSEKLTAPSREDRIERFLGRRSIPHRFARDSSGQPREEDLFDYIYRHTFARPREIVLMGLELSKVQVSQRNLATIVERVNSTAAVLFEQYKREVVPYFDDGLFEFFCERARQNVIPHATAYQIYCQARDERGFEHICSYFWRLGLLGLVEATPRGDAGDTAYIQRFLPVAERSLLGELVPDYPDYYLVHPAADRAFRSIVGGDLWSVDNIIGYDYPFSPPQQNGKAILHAHYGLDRDSLGVVLPALAANASIAVVQPSDGRQALLGSATTLVLRMNGAELLTFKVISEKSTANEIERVMREWLAGNNILVYGNQIDVARRIMARASSMSTCTSGIDLTTGLLRHIGHSSETLNTCHVFERTPKPSDTERIQRYFRSLKLPNATVVPVLVDRFVHSIDLTREGDRAIFETTTEVAGKLVTSVNHSGLLGGSALLHPTRSKAAQRFAGYRQQYLLEGSYKLCKIARSKHGESVLLASNKTWCAVFDIFFHIQIARALRRIPFRQWSAIFGQKEDSRVRNEMLEYCRAIKSRVVAIPKSYLSQFRRSEIATAKRDGFLPSDEEFYSLSRESALFSNTRAVNRLRELLRYDYRKDRRSVFISYSFKDHPFVRRFGDALIKRGVRVFYFQRDDPQKAIAAAMRDGVSSSDRLLFVASKHSLRSRACHYELTICRDRVGRDLGHQLLAIRLDNAVLNSTEGDFSGEAGRAEMWKNILYLREQNITDWSAFRNRTDSAAFEEKLDSLVDQSLARD